jgi:hypothetical protein
MKRNQPQPAIEHSLANMSTADLERLATLIADQITARRTAEAVTADVIAPTAKVKRKSSKRDSGEWEEVKTINGHQYRYRRYWQDGRLRSTYIGKA